jgi:hypothetical protein
MLVIANWSLARSRVDITFLAGLGGALHAFAQREPVHDIRRRRGRASSHGSDADLADADHRRFPRADVPA